MKYHVEGPVRLLSFRVSLIAKTVKKIGEQGCEGVEDAFNKEKG